MRLKTVQARQGVLWVRAGFRVFFRQPFGYSALFMLFAFSALVLAEWVPLVGPVLAMSLMPIATVAFMLATRETLAGRMPRPKLLVAPLRDRERRNRLLQLGAMYAAATLAMLLLVKALDGGRLEEAINAATDAKAAAEAIGDPMVALGLLMRLAAMALLSLTFWHAPALVCWAGLNPAKAVFASIVACWRSRAAFALYGLTWFALLLVFILLAQLLFALIGRPQLMGQALMPAGLLFSTVLYASVYFSFVDSFESDEPAAP